MKLDEELSNRITVLRFPLIVGVVWIHSFSSSVNLGYAKFGNAKPGPYFETFRQLVSEGITRLAVPMLFIIAGYLFFLGTRKDANPFSLDQKLVPKLKSRFSTLVIPYLFWNVALIVFLWLGHKSGIGYLFFGLSNPADYSLWSFVKAIFGPIAYQFWFIRNLILMSLLSPLVFIVARFAPYTIILLGLSWLLTIYRIQIPNSATVFFFTLGAALALHQVNLRKLDRYKWLFTALYAITLYIDLLSNGTKYSEIWHRFGNVWGLLALWTWTPKMVQIPSLKKTLIALAPAGFFLFAVHEPTLLLLRRFAYTQINPQSDGILSLLYIAVPVITIGFSLLIYRILLRFSPKTMAFVTGGR